MHQSKIILVVNSDKLEHDTQILHATVLDIKVYYYPRNITLSKVVITKTVKVHYLSYYTHCACIQHCVKALRSETMLSLSYQQ